MSRFPLIDPDIAPDAVQRIYSEFQSGLGLPDVPHFVQTLGGSRAMLAGAWGLIRNVMLDGELPRSIKELIFVAVAEERECDYCREAHAACCRMLGVEESTLQAVLAGFKGDMPEYVRDVLLFAIKCASAPEELDDEDYASLSRHGLDREQTLEVIAAASTAVYATIIADATMLQTDPMFATK